MSRFVPFARPIGVLFEFKFVYPGVHVHRMIVHHGWKEDPHEKDPDTVLVPFESCTPSRTNYNIEYAVPSADQRGWDSIARRSQVREATLPQTLPPTQNSSHQIQSTSSLTNFNSRATNHQDTLPHPSSCGPHFFAALQ